MDPKKSESQSGDSTESENSEQTQFTEADYKTLQATNETLTKERDEAKDELDLVTPFVDYGQMGSGEARETGEEESEPPSKESIEIGKLHAKMAISEEVHRFRRENPDLVRHEKIVTNFLLQQSDRLPLSKRMDKAVEATKKHLEAIRKEGADTAIAEKKKKDDEEAEAAGLGSKGPTSPKGEEAGQTDQEYIDERKEKLAKMQQPL